MLIVYLLPHGGDMLSFQMPCRFAGCEPGRELEMSRYRPYWKYNAARPGSPPAANPCTRSSVGVDFADGPRFSVTRLNSCWYSRTCAARSASTVLRDAAPRDAATRAVGSPLTSS